LWGEHGICVLESTPLALTGLAVIFIGIVSIVMVTTLLSTPSRLDQDLDGYEAFSSGLYAPTPEMPNNQGRKSGSGTPKARFRSGSSFSAIPAMVGSFADSEPGFEDKDEKEMDGCAKLRNTVEGCCCALLTAILAGSCLVPVNFNQNAGGATGIVYSVSFGLSAFVVATLLCLLQRIGSCFSGLGMEPLVFYSDWKIVMPCLVSGLLWNTGD